ncbi:YdcH family protein [Rhizobium sp.]
MTIEAHIETLEKKHGVLEEQLHSAMLHPSTDDAEIGELKRQKLRVKDQIERLRGQTQH